MQERNSTYFLSKFDLSFDIIQLIQEFLVGDVIFQHKNVVKEYKQVIMNVEYHFCLQRYFYFFSEFGLDANNNYDEFFWLKGNDLIIIFKIGNIFYYCCNSDNDDDFIDIRRCIFESIRCCKKLKPYIKTIYNY
jgi:hypothetical protein